MKRFIIAVLAALLAFSICSCDGPHISAPESTPEVSQSESESETESETTPESPEPEPTDPDISETTPESSESPTETEAETDPPAPAEPLKVMSYNVYTNSPDRIRVKKVVNNVKSFDPDIIGVQELNYSWITLLNMVTDFFDTYEMVGEPRLGAGDNSNNNEYSAIFYKKDKFTIVETDTYWLSNTPDKVSKFDETEYYRIMTYAVVERKSDGERFIHVNTHLATDKGARHKQIPILLSLSGTLLEKHGELPIYFTGDFNMTSKDAGYTMMLDWMLDDSRSLLEPVNTETTCGKSIIDYCFVGKDDFTVEKFDVGYGLEGSDHYPVYVEMYIK